VEIVNPELHLATLDSSDATLEMELVVEKGKGYLPSDGREAPSIGVIPIDAIFTPVRRVNYNIEHVRVGSRTDLDSLTLDIVTDGTISPNEALSESANLLVRYFSIYTELGQAGKRGERAAIGARVAAGKDYDRPIEDLDLSVRAYNCLKRSGITKIGQLLEMSEEDLLAVRNFGQKSLDELKQRLEAMGYVTPSAAPEEAGEETKALTGRMPSEEEEELEPSAEGEAPGEDEDEDEDEEGLEPEEVEAGIEDEE
jgi:DNA-directed RNA polymerase subunit alpha